MLALPGHTPLRGSQDAQGPSCRALRPQLCDAHGPLVTRVHGRSAQASPLSPESQLELAVRHVDQVKQARHTCRQQARNIGSTGWRSVCLCVFAACRFAALACQRSLYQAKARQADALLLVYHKHSRQPS